MTAKRTWTRARTTLPRESDYDKQTAQVYSALRVVKEHHEKMIEAGFTWDGVNSYTAPDGMTHQAFNEIVQPK